ncbi:MAG: diaminobutyrate--2-oxoglutarate transaminase [Candidatus Parabeggiatoa sp.]|nr:diaminobutyrate--2-oxoglutarate transaminase [Candidatus Parabeggiatoa sp.]
MRIIEQLESDVRSYVRSFPAVFDTAKGALLWDEQGNKYIDFFAGAGTLNYGHNHPQVNQALIEYLQHNGIVHSLDKATVAKRAFLQKLSDSILSPRNLEYKVQFTGPTGTNAVETTLKLARMVKKRSNIIAFTNAYHGLTMGALTVTGNYFYRDQSYGGRLNVDHMPFDGYLGKDINTIAYLRKFIQDNGSGVDLPAAIIVETIQGEGGINVASKAWLQELESLCREYDILLIVDDIQVGNGRTGTFFSFEEAGIVPDMVCLSKAIGGGLPLALVLMRPELDQWMPGEHTGTFRGNNLAFVAATELLSAYWENEDLTYAVQYKAKIIQEELDNIVEKYPALNMTSRGRGMVWGLEIPRTGFASELSKKAFENKLLVETCGSDGQVLKLLPPLIIEEDLLKQGLDILSQSVKALWEEKEASLKGGLF